MRSIVPVTPAQAAHFFTACSRHRIPPADTVFAVGVTNRFNRLVGVLVAGRPTTGQFDDGHTIEIRRVCTDGTTNTYSILYAAGRRAARALGYRQVITSTDPGEPNAFLRAAGWTPITPRHRHRRRNRPAETASSAASADRARTLWRAP